jgi:hypothetical protein
MTRITASTKIATPATRVDLSNDALADELTVSSFFYDADEFVSDRSGETSVAAGDFEIGIADAGEKHTHKCLTTGFWLFEVAE